MPTDNSTILITNPKSHKVILTKNTPISYTEIYFEKINLNIEKEVEKDYIVQERKLKNVWETLKNISTYHFST